MSETNTETVQPKGLNVHQRINAVMQEGSYLQKKGWNAFHKYKYAKESDYVELIRPLLVKHGLVLSTKLTHFSNEPIGDQTLTKVVMSFTLINIDDPSQSVTFDVPSQGTDKGDKGVYKCLTGAKKYFLATAFMIETGDDAEEDSPELSNQEKNKLQSVDTSINNTVEIKKNGKGGSSPFKKKSPEMVTTPSTNGSGSNAPIGSWD